MNEKGAIDDETWKSRMQLQIEEIEGPVNSWLTGEVVGHSPTSAEKVWHYIKHGGADDFARRWANSRR